MATTVVHYDAYFDCLMRGTYHLAPPNTFKVMLMLPTYTFDAAGHRTLADISTLYEVPATGGYDAGGKLIENTDVVNGVFIGDPVEWNPSSIVSNGFILYKVGATRLLSNLVMYCQFDSQTSENSLFRIPWNINGIIKLVGQYIG